MADLRAWLERIGCRDVTTLLASGNAVVTTSRTDGAALEGWLESEAKAIGLVTDFLVRDADGLRAVIAANPFPDAARAHPNHLVVTFHRAPVPGALVEAVAAEYAGPERLAVVGRELFVDYPDGIGDSKLAPALGRAKFPKLATARNWNTVTKLAALLSAPR